ncbi:MAG: ABC transporter permease subunit [Anaerolineales bacterium]|nr:ABC transporter permease subunit [Anaerolineales bacterium]
MTTRPIAPKTTNTVWPQRLKDHVLPYLLVAPPILLMTLLIFLPAGQAIVETVWIDGAVTVAEYIKFFQSPILTANLWFTFWITLATVGLLFVIGLPLSLYLRFARGRIAAAVQMLALFPLFVPGVILAYALIRAIGPHGLFDTLLHQIGIDGYVSPYLKPQGILIALVWQEIPFTVLVLTAGLRQVEDTMIESARDVGASDWQTFWRIIFPLIQRALVIVFSLNVIGTFGAFTIPYLLGPAQPMMMGVSMQQTFNNYMDRTGALTQAVLTFAFCAAVGVLYVRTVTRSPEGRP